MEAVETFSSQILCRPKVEVPAKRNSSGHEVDACAQLRKPAETSLTDQIREWHSRILAPQTVW